MTPAEAAKVLAVAGTYDARLRPPTRDDADARSLAWSAALAPGMTAEFAQQAVIRHYAENTDAVMPAHVNRAWKAQQRAEAERQQRLVLAAVPEGVPMPPEVKDALRAIGRRP